MRPEDADADHARDPRVTAARPLSPARMVRRGLTRRCPLCGSRGIFEGYFRQRERCPSCNFPTTRVVDQWIGALGINTIVCFLVLFVVLVVGFAVTWPDPPVLVLLTLSLAVAGLLPVLFYPISKSLWSAIDLAMRGVDPDDEVDPRFIPPPRRRRR